MIFQQVFTYSSANTPPQLSCKSDDVAPPPPSHNDDDTELFAILCQHRYLCILNNFNKYKNSTDQPHMEPPQDR